MLPSKLTSIASRPKIPVACTRFCRLDDEARERRPRTRCLIWVTTFDSAAIRALAQDVALKGAAEQT